jgi:hypothetical protein
MKKPRRTHKIEIEGEQATRLLALAHKWGVTPTEALRRALDQAFVGRGVMVALQTGLVLFENLAKKPPELEKKT